MDDLINRLHYIELATQTKECLVFLPALLQSGGRYIMLLVFFGLIAVGLAGLFLWTWLSGGPYTPIPQRKLDRLLGELRLRPGERFYDLGAGDGRVLLTAASRYGVDAIGYELNPVPWLVSVCAGLLRRSKAKFRFNNFYMADLENADIIFLHLISPGIHRLAEVIRRRARSGTRVVSYGVPLQELGAETVIALDADTKPLIDLFPDQAYLYRIP